MRSLTVTPTYYERLFGGIYLAVQLLLLPSVLAVCNLFFRLQLSEAELNFTFFALNFICVTVIFHRFLLKNSAVALRTPLRVLAFAIGGYFLYAIATNLVSWLIYFVNPAFYNVNDSYISQMLSSEFGIMFTGTVILVPIAEELLYRGMIFGSLYNRNRFLAYAVSVLLFAVLHVYSYIGTYPPVQLLLCLLEYLPAGIVLGWAYSKTDTILTPILIHMAVNAIAVSVLR